MKAPPIDALVHRTLFPNRKPTDPPSFHAFLSSCLVLEVRQETARFYGSLDAKEAQYPGLDYAYAPHRRRLAHFTWHRRLFRAFDALGLTRHEIAGLTKWEGTRWAKERYESEQGVRIRDTTADGIGEWVEPALRPRPAAVGPGAGAGPWLREGDAGVKSAVYKDDDTEVDEEEGDDDEEQPEDDEDDDEDDEDEDEDDEDSDEEMHSVGDYLNARMRAAAPRIIEARAQGREPEVMDDAWEQWLKEATEAAASLPQPSERR